MLLVHCFSSCEALKQIQFDAHEAAIATTMVVSN
jgi:hypothetical protein